MCNRHSFIVTRAGKVFDGLGITDSHTTIRELCGLHANDDTVNAYEWQPPKGWPDADWETGLTKDTEVFEPKLSHLRAMERHVKKLYPTMSDWNTPDRFRVITVEDLRTRGWIEVDSGAEITPAKQDHFFVAQGGITVSKQSGGYCWALNSATLNASAQSGGDCRAYDSATLNASAQSGGDCRAYDSATLNASAQSGGDCRAYDSATLNASAQSGGDCRAYDSATLNASAQSGGDCLAYDSATLNASAQSGGDCLALDSATLNASAQSGGDCLAYDSATLNASAQSDGYCWALNSATLNKID